MPVNRRSNKIKQQATQPQLGQDDFQRFVNEESQSCFDFEIKERKFHQEKGFLMSTKELYGPLREIVGTIDTHQWSKFATHPHNPIASLVREFYANILTTGQTFSVVRGIKVSFSALSIDMHYGLPKIEDEYNPLLKNIFEEVLSRMLKDLTVEGTVWLKEKGEKKCSRSALKPLTKVWYHII